MSLEESNKMSKETPSQDSNSEWLDKTYNDMVEKGNDHSPDIADMLWTAAKKQSKQDK